MRWWGIFGVALALSLLVMSGAYALCSPTMDDTYCDIPGPNCPGGPRCPVNPPTPCPMSDPGVPTMCQDSSGNYWQSVHFSPAGGINVNLLCGSGNVEVRQTTHLQFEPAWGITIGDGSSSGFTSEVNNAPYKATLTRLHGGTTYSDGNDNPNGCNYNTGAGCAFVGVSNPFKAKAFPGPSLATDTWSVSIEYNKYHMFKTSSPSTLSSYWDMASVPSGNIRVYYPYYNDYTCPGSGWGCTDLYACCGSWRTMQAGSAGTTWSNPYYYTGGNAKDDQVGSTGVCCGDSACYASNKCIPQGLMGDGDDGGYSGSYGTKSWVCGRDGSAPAAFYKCTSAKAGQTLSLGGGQNYCCQNVGGNYEFTNGACGAGGGTEVRVVSGPYSNPTVTIINDADVCSSGNMCNPGDSACRGPGLQGGQPGSYSGDNWLCGMSSEVSSYLAGLGYPASGAWPSVQTRTQPNAFVQCTASNNGSEFLSGAVPYCCARDPATCPSGPAAYKFTAGPCVSVCTSPLDPSCNCEASGTTVYIGPNGGTTWTGRVADPPNDGDASCNVATQCARHAPWPPGSECLLPGNIGDYNIAQKWSWGCAKPSAATGPAQYYCDGNDPALKGHTLTDLSDGTTVFCCKNDGQWALNSTTTDCANPPACNPSAGENTEGECIDGFDNDGDCAVDCADTSCDGTAACSGCAGCFISGTCYPNGASNPSNACKYCNPSLNPSGWSNRPNGFACNDGQSCTLGDTCQSGFCTNYASCDTGASCTASPPGPGTCAQVGPACVCQACVTESIATSRCWDGLDNDCDGKYDYDGFRNGTIPQPRIGDELCQVGVTTIAPADTSVTGIAECSKNVTFTCTSTAPSVRSINGTLGGVNCGFVKWSGNVANFTCALPASDNTYQAKCFVNSAYSTPTGVNQTANINVNCRAQIAGKVTSTDGLPIGGVTVKLTDAGAMGLNQDDTDSNGDYALPTEVTFGLHNVTATLADPPGGYYEGRAINRLVDNDPEVIDFALDPWQCNADCTFGESGRCDYSCLGDGGCDLPLVDDADEPAFMGICNDAPVDSTRYFNASHVANCCVGPIEGRENYQAPLTIKTCATQLVPHTILVNHDGSIRRLTIVTYRSC